MDLQKYIKDNAEITKSKGFDISQYTLQLLLIIDEVMEAMEELDGIGDIAPEINMIYLSIKETMNYFRHIRKTKLVHDKSTIKNTDHFIEELADIFIRLMSFVEQFDSMKFEEWIIKKMEMNKNRPIRHGKKF